MFSQDLKFLTQDLSQIKTEYGTIYFDESQARIIDKNFTQMPDSLVDYCGLTTKQLIALNASGSVPSNTIITYGPIDGWLYGYTFYSLVEKLIFQIEARDLIIRNDGKIHYRGTAEKAEESFKTLEFSRANFKVIEW